MTGLEHRRLLDHAQGFRPFSDTGLFARIGGQPTVDRLVDLLYDGIDGDRQLRPLFPRELAGGRSMQKVFFTEWLGGPRRYSERAYAGLRHRHDGLPITPALAERWLGHFHRAVEATVAGPADRLAISAQVSSLALALVTDQAAPHQVAWCGKGARSVARPGIWLTVVTPPGLARRWRRPRICCCPRTPRRSCRPPPWPAGPRSWPCCSTAESARIILFTCR